MFEITPFKAEKEVGFTSKELSKASISYLVPLEHNPSFDSKLVTSDIINLYKSISAENSDLTLFPYKSVLVSTIWNGNDDYFHKEEIWAAKYTPRHKPVNYEHAEDDIIGHMIDSMAISEDAKQLNDDLALDELPEKYHILSSSVLYKHWSDKAKQERMNKIIEEIPTGVWFVSVECLFPKFDYVLRDEEGNYKIIARNNETSFLTKCLRCYGGKGKHEKYPAYEIGRLPRNLIISGKGLVKKPANPESIILAKKYDLISESKIVGYDIELSKNKSNLEVNKMDEKEFKRQLDEKNAEITKLQASLQENGVKEFKLEIEGLKKQVADKDAKVVSVETLLETAKSELKATQIKFDEADKVRKDLADKFAKLEIEKKVSERFALVTAKLKLDETKAKKLVEILSVLTDEQFNANIDMQAELLQSNQKTEKETVVTETKKADEKVLETVKANASDTVVVKETLNDGVEKTRANIAAFMSNFISQTKNK